MATPPIAGAARAGVRSTTEEDPLFEGYPEGYLEPESPTIDIEEQEAQLRRILAVLEKGVEETSPGKTDEEKRNAAIDKYNGIIGSPDIGTWAVEAHAAEGTEEDTKDRSLLRMIVPRKDVISLPGTFSPEASYRARMEEVVLYQIAQTLKEAENLSPEEAAVRALQSTASRQEGGGQNLVDRFEQHEKFIIRPGVTGALRDIVNESAIANGLRSGAGFLSEYINPWHDDAPAEKYYGSSRGRRWWRERSTNFNSRVIYPGHSAEKAHPDVAHPDTGHLRPWYETVEIRAASEEEVATYNQHLEQQNLIARNEASFLDTFTQYIKQRDAWLKEMERQTTVGALQSTWIAQPSDWVANWKKGIKPGEDPDEWDDIDTYPTNAQLPERIKAAIALWRLREEKEAGTGQHEEMTKRLDRAIQQIPSDMWPDQRLRVVHRNEVGEASWATRAGHMRNSAWGDLSMGMNPVMSLLNPYGPSIDLSGIVQSAKASRNIATQTAFTVFEGMRRIGPNWDIPGWELGETSEALWGSSQVEDLKKFFDNEELIADNDDERKSILYRMILGWSRADIHINELVLDVPEYSDFKKEFLAAQDFEVAAHTSLADLPRGQEYLTWQMGDLMNSAKHRAEEEGMTLEQYVDTDDGWDDIESRLNKMKLFMLPSAMSSGVITKMGGYEGFRRNIEGWTEAREKAYGREDRQFGKFLGETLGNAMTNSSYGPDGTTLNVEEGTAGAVLRVGSTVAFDPIAETVMDLFFDPVLSVGDQFGLWDWDGRANDRGGMGDWWIGLEDPEAAGFMGRFQDVAGGLGYDPTDAAWKRLTALGLFFDVAVPGEAWMLTTATRPIVGTSRLLKIYEDMPGLRLSSDTLRAAYLPEGFFGYGSLWKKIAPIEDIATYEKAVDVAEAGAEARRAETVERLGRRGLRERVFGDPELNIAERRLKRARRHQQGLLGWRRAVPGLAPRELRADFGGMHDITSMMAREHFNKNLLQGRNPLEGFGPRFRSNVYEVMRRAGIKAKDVKRVLEDSSKMRTAKFLSEAAERLDSVDDYTTRIRESDSYVRLRDELEAAHERNPLSFKSLRGVDAIDAMMALAETIGVAAARTRGLEGGERVIDVYMQQWLKEIDAGRFTEPPSLLMASSTDAFDAAKQAVIDSIPAGELKTIDVDLSDEAQLAALRDATRYETINAIGSKANLRTISMDMLVTLLSRVSKKSDIVADLLGEISHRLAKEFADTPLTAQSKFDEFVELLAQVKANRLAGVSDEVTRSAIERLYDRILEDVEGRVRRARATLDDATEAKVAGAQADAGRAQIVQSIRVLVERGFLEAKQAAVLEALVMSLPERVLRDIRLSEQVADIAGGAVARTTELLSKAGPVDRLISSVEFFGYADEIGTLKAAESPLLLGANLDEIFEAIRYNRDEGRGFGSVGLRFLSGRKNPATGKTYTARQLSERYVDAETWMRRQQGEVFSPDEIERLVEQKEQRLRAYKRGADRVGPRTYQFLHELGHAVAMSFLADSEIAILSKAFMEELDDFGLFRDTPYTRSFKTMTDIQFNEWFAENFAEFVITQRLPKIVETQRGAGDLLRIFNNLMERMSNWFSSWYRRYPRARTDFHPALADLVDRLFDDKAAAMASRREVALRRATRFQVRLADEGIFSALSRQRAGFDGQYIPDLDEVEIAQDLLRMEEELPPAELRMAEKDLPVSGERAILTEELEAIDARRQAETAESVRENLGDVRLRRADGEGDYSLADLQRGANQPRPEIDEKVSRAFFTTLGFDLKSDAAGRAVNTSGRLKIYPLKEAFGDTVEAVDRTIDDWTNRTDTVGSGWKFEVFGPVFDDKGQVTGFKPPNFREKSYPQKTAWIYQPMELQGSFGDYAYTKAWRVTHEIAHGLVNEILTSRYGGEGRRAGALGIESVGPGGKTHPPLSLADALRALEWEHETFLMQRRIIEDDFGIKIKDAQFNEEYALNMSDAAFRVLTGQFSTPGQLGVIPKSIPVEEAFERAKTLVRQAAAEMGLDMRGSFDVEVTVAAVGVRPEFIEAQLLMNRANEARKSRDAATSEGTRQMYQRQLDTANRRLYLLLEPDLKKALTEGLDPDLVQITNLTEAGDFQRSLGVFADYAPEGGFYVTLKGPRDIILGRVAEYSRAYNQDAMLVRERIKTVEIDKTKPLIEQISFDDKGVQRGATARIVIPGAFEGGIAEAIVKSLAENQTGATIRLDTLKDGRSVIELVHVPEWIRKDLKNYEEAISIETFSDIVDDVADDIRSYAKKKKLGDVEVTFEQESVYAVSHSRGASDAATNAGFYEYWIERSRNQLREQGREVAPLFERAEEGVGPGAEARGPRLQPGGERPAVNGSNSLLDIPGAADRIGPEIRRILNERDVLDSGHFSEELAAEFDLSSEVLGGTPHDVVDFEIDSGLKQRVHLSEITAYQAELIKVRLGKASPLEDISTDTKFTVERIVKTPEGTRIERSEVVAPVYPMLKATGFAGEQGKKILIPGGKDGVFSFADVQYLARRPAEMITSEAATKWWGDVGKELFGDADSLGNFDEIIDQYKDAYSSMMDGMYDKLHSSYGLEKQRPNANEFFSNGRFKTNDAKVVWQQQMEIHLMDVASQYVFAFLSMQTNLLDNQIFAAVVRPRSMADLGDVVDQMRTAKKNKGSALSRDEANHILGFSLTISQGVLKDRFGKTKKLLDVDTDILPIIEIHDWTKPGGPLIRIQSVDIAPLNASKIAGKTRTALGKYVKAKQQVAKMEARIPKIKDAAKRRRAKSQLKKAIKEMEAADMSHRALLNSVSAQDVVALTGDVVLSSPADTAKLLDMYEMMYEDFMRVQQGDLLTSFFERFPDETWDAFSDRVSSMVPGMATKISAFGIYWQNPIAATIGALDIHMIGMVGKKLLKEEYWLSRAEVWHKDWQAIKSDAAKKSLKETAETQLLRESKTKKAPSAIAISKRAKAILEKELRARQKVSFEEFIQADKSNPGYTFWRDQLRSEITAPDGYIVHPTGVPEYAKAFAVRRIDSAKVKKLIADVKANKDLKDKQRATRTALLERSLKAHKHIENAQRMFGERHPIIAKFVDDLNSGAKKHVEVMSSDYKTVLDSLARDAKSQDTLGAVATRQHKVWDEWRGYLDPHVIVQPGSAMLPGVRPAALKAIIKALEDSLPEIKDPRVQAELTKRHSRLVSGLFGKGFRDLHASFKEGSFGGAAPFEGRPRPTELSKGALYMADTTPPLGSLDTFIDAGADMADFFNKGDLSVLFNKASSALLLLLGEEFPQAMAIFTEKFDSVIRDDGVAILTERGFGEVKEAFTDFWHERYVPDPAVDMAFEGIRDKLAVFWRRLRHTTDRTNPGVRRFFDEWLGVLNDAKKEAMFDVKNSAEFKEIPRLTVEEFRAGREDALLAKESIAKRGRAREATRIDLDEGRIRHALDLGPGVTEVDAFKTMESAVAYVSSEMSRQKYANNWVSFSTRSIVPARMLPRYLEEVQLRVFGVFGDPHTLKKQFKNIPLERVKRDEFGKPVMDTTSWDDIPEMEVATEVLPSGEVVPIEITVIDLTELQQGRLKNLLIELASDPRTRGPVQQVLGEYLVPGAELSRIPETHYNFIVQEMVRDHVVGVGTGATKEMKNVPKSLGYAAVKGIADSWLFDATGGANLVRILKKGFKTRAPLEHLKKVNEKGEIITKEGQIVSPVVQELFMRRERQIGDIPNWIRRVQSALRDGKLSAGVYETLEGLKNVLERPIHQSTYRALDDLERLFAEQGGISSDLIASQLDNIARCFADNRLMTPAERKAIDLLRDVENIKIMEPERTMVKGGKVYIKDPVMREAIGEAYLLIDEGIMRRLEKADNAARTIMEGFGGSPEQKFKLFSTGDGKTHLGDRHYAMSFYNLFYHGEWGRMLHTLAKEGLSTGTALKYPGMYNIGHAMLETVIRLRAQSIFMDLLGDMTDMGMRIRIDDIAPASIKGMAERRAFVERVQQILNEELGFGGPKTVVDESGRVTDVYGGFQGVKTWPETGLKKQGAAPGVGKLSSKAAKRLREIGGYRRPVTEAGEGILGRSAVHDLEAHTMANQLIEQWGMKYGANITNWELTRFIDGSEALVPKPLLDEIAAATDRVAGTASARAGGMGGIYKMRIKLHEFVPEVGKPKLSTEVKYRAKHVMELLGNSYGFSYRMMKMGLTSGIFMVNLPYYMANFVGAQLQVYQTLGIKGYFSSTFRHGPLSLEIAAALWGDSSTMRWRRLRPVVMPDGTVWTKQALIKACHEQGLTGSFLSKETARSVSEDLKKNEPSFFERMMESEIGDKADPAYPYSAGVPSYAVPGPARSVRFYHQQLINFATFIDNFHRVGVFVEGIGKGLSPSEAAAASRRALFDYSDLTDFEKKYMRQAFIFYSFQRKNLNLFWDTLLTNPHRVMGQLRFARGLNQIYLDGDERLIGTDWDVGRVGIMYKNNAANRLIQKTRYNAPILPVMEAIRGQLDFFSFLGSFIPTDDVMLAEKRMKNRLKFLGRLNPWLQAPVALTLQKKFFSSAALRPERIPLFFTQHDLLTTGGMVMRSVGARVRPIKPWEEQEFPGQIMVWEAADTTNWYLLQNIWHGPMPVMPMREDTPGTSWMGPIGEAIDYSPLGMLLRLQPIKGFREGTIGISPAGRMIDSLNRFGRAGMIIPEMLEADMQYYKSLVEDERRGSLAQEGRLSLDQLGASGFQIDPETGDIDFARTPTPEGGFEPIIGARGRVGVDEGWKAILFGPQQIPTEDAAILKLHYRITSALRRAAGEMESTLRDRPLDVEGRYLSEGSD